MEKRVKQVEEAVLIMKDLLIRYDERLDYFQKDLKETKEDFNFKLNALIDSQIRNETEFKEIRGSINDLKESIIEMRKLSESTIKRVERLENNN